MKKIIIVTVILGFIIVTTQTCKKDKKDVNSDNALFSEVNMTGYTYYQNGAILPGSSPSPHGSFKLRFNSTATTVLDDSGELPVGRTFPPGSIIVKEIHDGNNISLYAVMKKDPSNTNASNGWIWAEFSTNGSAAFSTGKKGNGCTSCHSGTPNRDLIRTFDLH